jgi:hypothetical protein
MLLRPTEGIGLWLYRTSFPGFEALLDFRESRYDVCIILRGTPAPENALIACVPILSP